MLKREKMFLVAGNIDDSIKSQTSVYDLVLFKTFVDFEKYVNETPVIINTLIITSYELEFTNTNMQRIVNILKSPFLTITGSIVYLIDSSHSYTQVNKFLEQQKMENWAVYQGDLSVKFIADIVSGEGRQSTEGRIDLVTYRIRAADYIKRQQVLGQQPEEAHYYADEEQLEGIPDETEPIEITPHVVDTVRINYVVGKNDTERTLFAFLLAQYRAMMGRTLIFEKDNEYHTLTDMVTKTGIVCEFISVDELILDITGCIKRIRASSERLIVIGAVRRTMYDYNFLADILVSNLKQDIAYFVRECSFDETPYGHLYTIVCANTVPSVLECCNSLKYDVNVNHATFVGMELNNIWPACITTDEMTAVISQVLGKNNVAAQVVKINGLVLKGEEVIYDILGVLSRADRR